MMVSGSLTNVETGKLPHRESSGVKNEKMA
jgi:hypothetical protein